MTTLRRDFLTGEWVTISEQRDLRPMEHNKDFRCPFCPENIDLLTDPVYSSKRVKIVKNLYPAFDDDNGFHEVLIDTPIHNEKLHEFTIPDILEIFEAIKIRLKFFAQYEHIKYIQVFKNNGAGSGASIGHSHWQIVAMPVIPSKPATIAQNFNNYFSQTGACYLCSLSETIEENDLVVWEDNHTMLHVPYSSQYKSGLRIYPKQHYTKFLGIDETTLESIAMALKLGVFTINQLYQEPSYNICFQEGTAESSHFFIQIIPRMGNMAGFEFGSGCYINSSLPEHSAKNLREVLKAKKAQE